VVSFLADSSARASETQSHNKESEKATMNPEGAIATFETQEDADKAGYTIPLTRQEAKVLRPRNRHERRVMLVELRKKAKKRREAQTRNRG
jgi:hypothetical protein